jgi:hypothetical protein
MHPIILRVRFAYNSTAACGAHWRNQRLRGHLYIRSTSIPGATTRPSGALTFISEIFQAYVRLPQGDISCDDWRPVTRRKVFHVLSYSPTVLLRGCESNQGPVKLYLSLNSVPFGLIFSRDVELHGKRPTEL